VGTFEPKPFAEIPDARAMIKTNSMSGARFSRRVGSKDAGGRLATHHFHFERIRGEYAPGK
jgi:hypothetical protein